jgi:MoaA/NifB/PqqE/SkfB family radical SAM enzyme
MIEILPKIPLYMAARAWGRPGMLPLSYTLGVTYRCNSRCKTCNVYERKAKEFDLAEYEKVFNSIGKGPVWFTISGGEPFLRGDLVDICKFLYRICRPKIINIPTNGILSKKIPEAVEKIAEACPETNLIINLSLDQVGEKHDELREVPGNYQKAMETYAALRELKYPNFTLGIHTVISQFNVNKIPDIYRELIKLDPDSYITEIAEERVELGTMGASITPDKKDYDKAVDFLMERIREKKFKGITRITQAFRLQYYQMVKDYLAEEKQIFPCYAGILSCQIAPDGDVWPCCIRADVMGNLREAGYDFKKVWFSSEADSIRKSIKNRDCSCPLANASYTNMLASPRSLIRAALYLLR